jgi:hypothetical protein
LCNEKTNGECDYDTDGIQSKINAAINTFQHCVISDNEIKQLVTNLLSMSHQLSRHEAFKISCQERMQEELTVDSSNLSSVWLGSVHSFNTQAVNLDSQQHGHCEDSVGESEYVDDTANSLDNLTQKALSDDPNMKESIIDVYVGIVPASRVVESSSSNVRDGMLRENLSGFVLEELKDYLKFQAAVRIEREIDSDHTKPTPPSSSPLTDVRSIKDNLPVNLQNDGAGSDFTPIDRETLSDESYVYKEIQCLSQSCSLETPLLQGINGSFHNDENFLLILKSQRNQNENFYGDDNDDDES